MKRLFKIWGKHTLCREASPAILPVVLCCVQERIRLQSDHCLSPESNANDITGTGRVGDAWLKVALCGDELGNQRSSERLSCRVEPAGRVLMPGRREGIGEE